MCFPYGSFRSSTITIKSNRIAPVRQCFPRPVIVYIIDTPSCKIHTTNIWRILQAGAGVYITGNACGRFSRGVDRAHNDGVSPVIDAGAICLYPFNTGYLPHSCVRIVTLYGQVPTHAVSLTVGSALDLRYKGSWTEVTSWEDKSYAGTPSPDSCSDQTCSTRISLSQQPDASCNTQSYAPVSQSGI